MTLFEVTHNIDAFATALAQRYSRFLTALGDAVELNTAASGVNINDMLNIAGQEGGISVNVFRNDTKNGTETEIVAKGPGVVFAEFGAGDDAGLGIDIDHLKNLSAQGVNVFPGSWSSSEGTKQYSTLGYWEHTDINGQPHTYSTIKPMGAFTAEAQKYKTTGLKYMDTVKI